MASSNAADAGFMTPIFGVLAVSLGLVAIATTQLSRTSEVGARRDYERRQAEWAAEGAANQMAWRILHAEGDPTLTASFNADVGSMVVLAEPEGRKLSVAEVAGQRGQRRLAALVGATEGKKLAVALAALRPVGREPPSRLAILGANATPAWRACGLSLVSPFSRLTDSALTPPEPHVPAPLNMRAGEVWRLTVRHGDRVILDRLVRFTGDARRPAATLDDIRTGSTDHVETCVSKIQRSEGPNGVT